MKNSGAAICPLCGDQRTTFFFEDKFREYRRCEICRLIFVPSEFHVSTESEKARYLEHNNDPDDAGYRAFLSRIVEPVSKRFAKGALGLDYGCGPTPLLATVLKEAGYEIEVFDPIFSNDQSVLKQGYDFVVTTEVIEHVKQPMAEIRKLLSFIDEDGMLALMTRPFDESVDFKGWHYKNDRTHICFFSKETFDWVAEDLGIEYQRAEHDIFVFDLRQNR